MKSKMIMLISLIVSLVAVTAQASHYVTPYSRANGSFVPGHMSQDPGEARSSGYSYHDNELVPNN